MTLLADEETARHAVQALLDASVDAVIIIDRQGRIESFNRAAEGLFGYQAAEVVGLDVSVLMPDPHRSQHNAHIGRYLATGEAHVIGHGREVPARRKNGTEFPAWLAVGRIDDGRLDPAAPYFVGFLHDLTFRHQAAEEERLLAMRQAQVQQLAAMASLAADIAHEVNQPLAAITNYAKACERMLDVADKQLPGECQEVKEALRQIAEQALRAGDGIRRLRGLLRRRQEGSTEAA